MAIGMALHSSSGSLRRRFGGSYHVGFPVESPLNSQSENLDPEKVQADLQAAVNRYALSYAQSKKVGNAVHIDPMEVMHKSELVSVQFGLLLDILESAGVFPKLAWKLALTQRFNDFADRLEQQAPKIAIVPGSFRR